MRLLFLFISAIMLNSTFIMPPAVLTVTSPAFRHNDTIPPKYTCEGSNVSPELRIAGIPSGAKSLALIVDDPDAPMGTVDHWIVWNIPVTNVIGENTSPGTEGKNVKKENQYTGPCPPTGTHHYHFKVYALDARLDLKKGADKKDLESAMKQHILAQGELVGLYRKMQGTVGTK